MILPVERRVRLLSFPSEQRGEKADAVGFLRDRRLSELAKSREQIPKCANMLAGAACADFAGPARKKRHANSSFIEIAFQATQRPGTLKELRDRILLQKGRTIIAGKKNERL